MGWSSGTTFDSYLECAFFRISDGIPAILTEVCCSFTQSLQAIAGIVPQLDRNLILQNPFHFVIHLFVHLTCVVEELKALLNNPQGNKRIILIHD